MNKEEAFRICRKFTRTNGDYGSRLYEAIETMLNYYEKMEREEEKKNGKGI
jgi:hypothetical protein